MSLTLVRSYFRTRMNELNFKEWKDGFNFENIPSTLLNNSYHIESNQTKGEKLNQNDQVILSTVSIRLFKKGYKDPASAIDLTIQDQENILLEILNPQNRIGGGIKTIKYLGSNIEPLNTDNDNAIILKLDFECLITLGL